MKAGIRIYICFSLDRKVPHLFVINVSPDMLFRGLFVISNPKKLFGNRGTAWYLELLGTVDSQYPVF
jgi:hypothetical protein